MKIAVAAMDDKVSMHFGRCKNFVIFDVDNKNIVNSQSVASPGHGHGILPEFLAGLDVDLVISGGMGSGAAERLKQKNIRVVLTGASGFVRETVEAYLRGELNSVAPGPGCHDHEHHHHHHDDHGGSCGCGNH